MNTTTPWGTVTQDNDGRWIVLDGVEHEVLECGEHHLVVWAAGTPKPRYRAFWVDETGKRHDRLFVHRRVAIEVAKGAWGR